MRRGALSSIDDGGSLRLVPLGSSTSMRSAMATCEKQWGREENRANRTRSGFPNLTGSFPNFLTMFLRVGPGSDWFWFQVGLIDVGNLSNGRVPRRREQDVARTHGSRAVVKLITLSRRVLPNSRVTVLRKGRSR